MATRAEIFRDESGPYQMTRVLKTIHQEYLREG